MAKKSKQDRLTALFALARLATQRGEHDVAQDALSAVYEIYAREENERAKAKGKKDG